jgi:hypothetical protein
MALLDLPVWGAHVYVLKECFSSKMYYEVSGSKGYACHLAGGRLRVCFMRHSYWRCSILRIILARNASLRDWGREQEFHVTYLYGALVGRSECILESPDSEVCERSGKQSEASAHHVTL